LRRFESGTLVEEEELRDGAAPAKPGEACHFMRAAGDHGMRRPPSDKTLFKGLSNGLV
jgi:hypothetical protein